MKLALRRNAATDATFMQKSAVEVIKYVLVTDFPHAGIVIGDVLYHSNATYGLHKTEFTPERWVLVDLGDERDSEVLALFEQCKGAAYDWFELFDFTAFKAFLKQLRKFSAVDKELQTRLYCFQWCYLAMTGTLPVRRVTAENLLHLAVENLQQRLVPNLA